MSVCCSCNCVNRNHLETIKVLQEEARANGEKADLYKSRLEKSEKLQTLSQQNNRRSVLVIQKLTVDRDTAVKAQDVLKAKLDTTEAQRREKTIECATLKDQAFAHEQAMKVSSTENAKLVTEREALTVELVALKKALREKRDRAVDLVDRFFDIVVQVNEPAGKKSRVDNNQEA